MIVSFGKNIILKVRDLIIFNYVSFFLLFILNYNKSDK